MDHIYQLGLAAWSLVLSWLHIARRDEVADMKRAIAAAETRAGEAEEALAEHKLFAAENYARRAELKEAVVEMKAALGQTESRLTASNEKLAVRLEEIRDRLLPKS